MARRKPPRLTRRKGKKMTKTQRRAYGKARRYFKTRGMNPRRAMYRDAGRRSKTILRKNVKKYNPHKHDFANVDTRAVRRYRGRNAPRRRRFVF